MKDPSFPSAARNWKVILLNVFIGVHIWMMFFWGLPQSRFSAALVEPLARYYRFVGLGHNWAMFAPSPSSVNYDLRAEVKYQDGSTKYWIAPRMQELSVWKRVPKERYRKWREIMVLDIYAPIWGSSAAWVARQMNHDPKNPPVQVRWKRFWAKGAEPIPGQDYQPIDRSYTPERATNWNMFAECEITAKQLR